MMDIQQLSSGREPGHLPTPGGCRSEQCAFWLVGHQFDSQHQMGESELGR